MTNHEERLYQLALAYIEAVQTNEAHYEKHGFYDMDLELAMERAYRALVDFGGPS